MADPSYKTCSSGHFYSATLSACPYCAKSTSNTADNESTHQILNSGTPSSPDDEKTQVMSNQHLGDAKHTTTKKSSSAPGNGDRTIIHRSKEPRAGQSASRKLVGWLVSYTLDAMGIDFRIFEGQNTVGRDVSSSIRIIEDTGISTRHATILYRNGSFYLRDEMASNPSFVNSVEVMPGSTVTLKDGDLIKINSTILKLRTAE